MNIQELRNAIRTGGRVYGTLIASPSPHWPIRLKKLGLDFVFLDTEHIALDRGMLSWMCRTYGAIGLPAIVRIPSPDPYAASQALDGGAAGIVAPYIETVEQVQALRGAVKLRPLKGKRLARILCEEERPESRLKEYLAERNENNLLLVNIESVPAVENLDAILAVPGLDGILVGPHDLSCSLGIPEEYRHPRFTDALKTIVGKTRENERIAGAHYSGCGPVSGAIEWIRMGVNLLIQQGDIFYAAQGVADDLEAIHAALGEGCRGGAESLPV